MTLLYFHAPWCGPCKQLGPIVDAAKARHTDVMVRKVDVSQEQAYAAQYHIQSVPTLLVLKGARVVEQAGAVDSAGLDRLIERARA